MRSTLVRRSDAPLPHPRHELARGAPRLISGAGWPLLVRTVPHSAIANRRFRLSAVGRVGSPDDGGRRYLAYAKARVSDRDWPDTTPD